MRTMKILIAALALVLVTTFGGYAATIKVTVNGIEITDLQISARAALMRLEHRGKSNSDG